MQIVKNELSTLEAVSPIDDIVQSNRTCIAYTLHIESPASRPLVAGAAYSEVAGPGPGTRAEQPSADHHSVTQPLLSRGVTNTS